MNPAFAIQSRGFLVERLQVGLSTTEVKWPDGVKRPALDPKEIDGQFGPSTGAAVRLVQAARGDPQTSVVDAALWQIITGETWPSEFLLSLHLTAGFEGHGFTLPAGNWDGAGITWGIIGFTLQSNGKPNTLPKLLGSIIAAYPAVMQEVFGKDAEMLKKVKAVPSMKTGAELLKFADEITDWVPRKSGTRARDAKPSDTNGAPAKASKPLKDSKASKKPWYGLLKPWEDAFFALGGHPEVQDLQIKLAKTEFYDPALVDAAQFVAWFPSLNCEQTRQLFFDIHVNNTSPDAALKQAMKAEVDKLDPLAPVSGKLLAITEVLATRIPGHAKDIRERKGTIARGSGVIHGMQFHLDGWGLRVAEQALKFPTYLGVLSFEPQQTKEQLTLAAAARQFVNPEAAVVLGLPEGSGAVLLSGDLNGSTVSTLSLRPLLSQEQAFSLAPDAGPLNQAISVSFSRPIGMLAVFGQSAAPKVATPRLMFARGPGGYAGLDVAGDGSLQLFRQRLLSEGPEMARMDISAVRRGLSTCQIIFLFGAQGIEQVPGESSPGRLWRDMLKPLGASPIVLGWFGNTGVPRDADGQFVSEVFLNAVHQLDTQSSLEQLVAKYSDEIVQLWGQSCHAAFAAGRQSYLWRGGPFSSVFKEDSPLGNIGLAGAAGIGRDGQLYVAKAGYTGQGEAMERPQ